MPDSPSAGTSTATHLLTLPVLGSMRAIPRFPHVAVHTAPNPDSTEAHGDCGTATEPRKRPVLASWNPTPLPTPLTHARPNATRTQSALAGARMASPPACRTVVILGSSGSGWGEEVCASLGLTLLEAISSVPEQAETAMVKAT